MIRLPDEIIRKRLAEIRRGTILRFWWEVAGKPKFGIVLNAQPPDDDLLLVITTSRTGFYDRHDYEADVLRIAAGAYVCFPKDTIVNLRIVHTVSVASLDTESVVIEGTLREADLALIDTKVSASRLISGQMKKRILTEY